MKTLNVEITMYNKKELEIIAQEIARYSKAQDLKEQFKVVISFKKNSPKNLETIINFLNNYGVKPDFDYFYRVPTFFESDVELPEEISTIFKEYNDSTNAYFEGVEAVKDLNKYSFGDVPLEGKNVLDIKKVARYQTHSKCLGDIVNEAMSYQDFTLYANLRTNLRADLDYNVDFQREQVWNLENKQKLVLSILSAKTLGAIYINKFSIYEAHEEDNTVSLKEYNKLDNVLYDGKQRISTLVDFRLGLFPIEVDGKEYYYHNIRGQFERNLNDMTIPVNVTSFTTRKDLIEFYVDINKYKVEHTVTDLQKALDLI